MLWSWGRGDTASPAYSPAVSGGDGLTFCRTAAELRAAVAQVVTSTDIFGNTNDTALIQRELRGRLYEVCTVSVAGQHEVVQIVETTKRGAVFDAMRVLPRAEAAQHAAVVEVAKQALDALGLRFGAAHVEIIYGPTELSVIEVAARLIGLLPPHLSQAVLGTDQVERLVELTLEPRRIGALPHPPRCARFARVIVLQSNVEGRIGNAITHLEAHFRALPSVLGVHLSIRPGDSLAITRDLLTAPGYIELAHKDEQQTRVDHAAIRSKLMDGYRSSTPQAVNPPHTLHRAMRGSVNSDDASRC